MTRVNTHTPDKFSGLEKCYCGCMYLSIIFSMFCLCVFVQPHRIITFENSRHEKSITLVGLNVKRTLLPLNADTRKID